MNLRKALALTAGLAAAATMLIASPAHAVENGNTTVTFNLVNGGLAVQVLGSTSSTRATAALGDVTPDGVTSQISGALLSTTVTDTRNALTGYTVSANCNDFSDGTHTVAKANATISIPAVDTASIGGQPALVDPTTLFVPVPLGTPCGASAGAIGARVSISSVSSLLSTFGATSANNTVTYTPHIAVTIPAGTPDGLYSSIVYQTAA